MTESNSAAPAPAPSATSAAPGGPPAPPSPRRRGFRVFVIALLVVAAGGGGAYWLHARQYESTDDAFIEGHIVYVAPRVGGQVLRVLVEDNQQVEANTVLAEIDARDYEARVAQARGALEAAKARRQGAGVSVELTGLTAKADVDAANAGIGIAKSAKEAAVAEVSAAKSRVEQAKAGVNSAQALVEQSKADVAASEAEANRAGLDLKRYRELSQTGSATKQQLDNAEAADLSATARLDASRKKVAAAEAQVAEAQAAAQTAAEGVKLAEAQVTQAASVVTQAEAKLAQVNFAPQRVDVSKSQQLAAAGEVEQLEGALRQAELQLEYTRILASQPGRVTRKALEQGAYVQPGQPVLAIVPASVWVVANFKETQLAHLEPNLPVTVHVDAYPDKVFRAHVDSIQAGSGARFSLLPPENATGNFVKVVQRVPVKIVLDEPPDPAHPLGPGMSVVPTIKVR